MGHELTQIAQRPEDSDLREVGFWKGPGESPPAEKPFPPSAINCKEGSVCRETFSHHALSTAESLHMSSPRPVSNTNLSIEGSAPVQSALS